MTSSTKVPWAVLLLIALTIGGCDCDSDGSSEQTTDTGNSNNDSDAGDTGTDTADCTSGGEGCACNVGAVCDTPLVCVDNVCVTPHQMGVTVSDPNARSCEVLLRETTAQITGATYASGVRGELVREAPRVAVAFLREGDDAFPADAVNLQIEGAADGFIVDKATCFDRLGAELSDADVRFR